MSASRPGIHRAPAGRRRWAIVSAAAALASVGAVGCLGDLFHPALPRVDYVFTPPIADTVLDVGDTSLALRCDLTANGRPVACALGLSWTGSSAILSVFAGKLRVTGYGSAALRMRPLNAQLPVDTIERAGTVRAVVPVVAWTDGRVDDTLAVGAMRLLLALPMTRTGDLVARAPLRWVVDSGQGVAHFVAGLEGWLHADAVGVAVIRVVSDTGSTPRRRVVVIPQNPAARPGPPVQSTGPRAP